MPTLALGQRWPLTFQMMGHRVIVTEQTEQSCSCPRYPPSHQGACSYSAQPVSGAALKFPLNLIEKMAVGLFCYHCLAAVFPEAVIITGNAIQWVMKEVRTGNASKAFSERLSEMLKFRYSLFTSSIKVLHIKS